MPDAVSGATAAPSAVPTDRSVRGLRRLTIVMTAFVVAVTFAAVEAPTPVYAASEASQVIETAKNQLGKPYRWGEDGLRRYDCSGLVWRVFERNGLTKRIGGKRSANGYWNWFRDRGLASKSNPRKGDLVVWGRGKHVGLYIGDGKSISALTTGVSRHGLYGLNVGFTAFLHVKLSR